MRLKYADPLAFNDLMRATEAAAIDAMVTMRDEADVSNIMEMQGYARCMKWLVTIIRDCNAMKR